MEKYKKIDIICRILCIFPIVAVLIDIFSDCSINLIFLFEYISQAGLWYALPYLFKIVKRKVRKYICFLVTFFPYFFPMIFLLINPTCIEMEYLKDNMGAFLLAFIPPFLIGLLLTISIESYYIYNKLMDDSQTQIIKEESTQIIRFIANSNLNAINFRIENNFNGAINLWRRSLVDLESAQHLTSINPITRDRINYEIESIKKNIVYTQRDLEDSFKPEFKETMKFFSKLDMKKKKALSNELEGNFKGALRIWNRSLVNLEKKSSERITYKITERINDEINYIKTKININEDEISKLPKRKSSLREENIVFDSN